MTLAIGPSRAFAASLALLHGAAAAVPWILGWTPWIAGVASAAALAWGVVQIGRQALRRSGDAIVDLALRTDGTAIAGLRDGRHAAGAILEGRCLGPWVVFLRLRLETGRARSLVIWRDACGTDALRRLRVWVRWHRGPAAAGAEDVPATRGH